MCVIRCKLLTMRSCKFSGCPKLYNTYIRAVFIIAANIITFTCGYLTRLEKHSDRKQEVPCNTFASLNLHIIFCPLDLK